MDKRNKWGMAFVSLSILFWPERCFGAQLPVEILGLPSTADSVVVVADGDKGRAPLLARASIPKHTPYVSLSLFSSEPQALRIRAVAFAGPGVFPIVKAIGATTSDTPHSGSARIMMTWPIPRVEALSASGEETTSLLVTFTGLDVLRDGDIAEMWIDSSNRAQNCSGTHFLAPFVKIGATWQALFVVSTHLYTGASVQVAFHALAFRVAYQIPLFVWPNREQNENPLQIVLATETRTPPSSTDGATVQEQLDPPISSYVIKTGPDGHLIRQPIGSNSKKPRE